MAYKIRRVSYDDVAITRNELITISEAAKILAMSKSGVISAMGRGILTEIVDESALKYRLGRRLLIKTEVLSFEARKNQ